MCENYEASKDVGGVYTKGESESPEQGWALLCGSA